MSPPLRFSVRQARLRDIDGVAELERRVWKEMAASPPRLRRRFQRFAPGFLVARAGKATVGFCLGVRCDRDAREAEVGEDYPPAHVPDGRFYVLFALTVDPVFRRRGVASRLVSRQLRVAAGLECAKVQLVANAYSRPLFERSGFQVVRPLEGLFTGFPELMPGAVLMEGDPAALLDGALEV